MKRNIDEKLIRKFMTVVRFVARFDWLQYTENARTMKCGEKITPYANTVKTQFTPGDGQLKQIFLPR